MIKSLFLKLKPVMNFEVMKTGNLSWSEHEIPENPTPEEIKSARELKKLLLRLEQDVKDAKWCPRKVNKELTAYLRVEFRRLDKIQKKCDIVL